MLVVTVTSAPPSVTKFANVRPHTVIVCGPSGMAAVAVSTRTGPAIAAADGVMVPVTGVAGVPLMKSTGNRIVMVSAVPVLTKAVARLKPITILRLTALTRSTAAMVRVVADTIPPMDPVEVTVLTQSRVVEMENIESDI